MSTRPILTALLASAALTGCGAEDDPATAAGRPAGEDAELAFAKCMRENGIDIPDPTAGGGPQRLKLSPSTSPQRVDKAMKTCRDKTGGGPREMSPEEQTKFRDAALEFAKCMRENGVDLPDPQADGGGIVVRRAKPGDAGGPDLDSPAFERAEKACRKLLPDRGRRAGTSREVGP